jgi:hypothetical protein
MQTSYHLRLSYWLLRDLIAFAPKKDDKYIAQRTSDAIGTLSAEIRAQWEEAAKGPVTRDLPEYADLMPVTEWLASVRQGGFIDYDGYGSLATEQYTCPVNISPSDITVFHVTIPAWATHIAWYNR